MKHYIQTENDWITTKEAARLFDYDPDKPGGIVGFLQFAQREGVPFYRMSARRFRWDREQLLAWLEKRRVGKRN